MTEDEIENFYSEFGRRVKVARARAEMTQAKLAENIGLKRASVANLEAGRQRVMLHVAFAAAEALKVSPVSLLPEHADLTSERLDFSKLDEEARQHPQEDRDFVLAVVRKGIVESGDL